MPIAHRVSQQRLKANNENQDLLKKSLDFSPPSRISPPRKFLLPRPHRTVESPSFMNNNIEDTNNAGLSIPGKIKHFWKKE